MRLVALSDTHLAHGQVSVPDGDLLVHAGDATRRGKLEELAPFLNWMAALPHRHKVFVAGNHDSCCERDPEAVRGLTAVRGIHYLCDEALELEGLRLFGSPVTPWFRGMAFTQARGPVIAETWAKIPTGLDKARDARAAAPHRRPHGARRARRVRGFARAAAGRAAEGARVRPHPRGVRRLHGWRATGDEVLQRGHAPPARRLQRPGGDRGVVLHWPRGFGPPLVPLGRRDRRAHVPCAPPAPGPGHPRAVAGRAPARGAVSRGLRVHDPRGDRAGPRPHRPAPRPQTPLLALDPRGLPS
ncbi:MAG: metallophosphoesterase [Myxococcales bacterium]|nr:metallophosphoesterase [Myxococcales bacterium]